MVAYVVRDDQLLVFDHRDFPEAGTQVPAGTVDANERPEESVVREVLEETGVHARVVRHLGSVATTAPGGEPRRNLFFQLEAGEERDEWEHLVIGGGEDRGLVFLCRFVPLHPTPELIADDTFLGRL